jgi:hypothetical protein
MHYKDNLPPLYTRDATNGINNITLDKDTHMILTSSYLLSVYYLVNISYYNWIEWVSTYTLLYGIKD